MRGKNSTSERETLTSSVPTSWDMPPHCAASVLDLRSLSLYYVFTIAAWLLEWWDQQSRILPLSLPESNILPAWNLHKASHMAPSERAGISVDWGENNSLHGVFHRWYSRSSACHADLSHNWQWELCKETSRIRSMSHIMETPPDNSTSDTKLNQLDCWAEDEQIKRFANVCHNLRSKHYYPNIIKYIQTSLAHAGDRDFSLLRDCCQHYHEPHFVFGTWSSVELCARYCCKAAVNVQIIKSVMKNVGWERGIWPLFSCNKKPFYKTAWIRVLYCCTVLKQHQPLKIYKWIQMLWKWIDGKLSAAKSHTLSLSSLGNALGWGRWPSSTLLLQLYPWMTCNDLMPPKDCPSMYVSECQFWSDLCVESRSDSCAKFLGLK